MFDPERDSLGGMQFEDALGTTLSKAELEAIERMDANKPPKATVTPSEAFKSSQNLEAGPGFIKVPGSTTPNVTKESSAKGSGAMVPARGETSGKAGPDYKTIAMLGGLLLVLVWLTKRR